MLIFALCFVKYALIVLSPYTGDVYVSEKTRIAFSIENFYSQHESTERVMLLEDPWDSFLHRVNLISKAKERILIASFAIHEGETSDIIVGALLSAADRGVDITIIVNAIGGAVPSRYMNVLSGHDNIVVYRFNRFEFFRPQFINAALHDKYMIVDDNLMILGGRNMGDKYYEPEGFVGRLSLDREVLVYNTNPDINGSIVEVTYYFNSKVTSERVFLNRRVSRNIAEQKNYYINLYMKYRTNPISLYNFDYYANTTRTNRITLITNPIDTAKKESVVAYNLMMIARNSDVIVAQSPYIVLTNRNLNFFYETIRGRDVTLSTNSLASTPNLPAFSAYYVNRRNILDTGITIYEFQSIEASLHSKTYLFDGRLTAIGSFNLNERSIRSDTESMLIIDSEEFHDIVLEAIEAQIAQSLRVGHDNRYEINSEVEAAPVSLGKRILYTSAGHLLRGFRFMF